MSRQIVEVAPFTVKIDATAIRLTWGFLSCVWNWSDCIYCCGVGDSGGTGGIASLQSEVKRVRKVSCGRHLVYPVEPGR